MRYKYTLFSDFLYRIPFFPVTPLHNQIFETNVFKEALFLASRDLFDLTMDESGLTFEDYPLKVKLSLTKYILRMSSRCTPFGLFAGCGMGVLNDQIPDSSIRINGAESYHTVTRLDMDLVSKLSKTITDNEKIKERLKYFVNNTLYQIGDQFRYVDFKFVNKNRKYLLSEIETNNYILQAIKCCEHGATISEIINALKNDEYSVDDIRAFIEQMIDSQILVNELYPNVTGTDPITRLLKFLRRPDMMEISEGIVSFLTSIQAKLKSIDDSPVGRNIEDYLYIENQIKKLGLSYNRNYLFQSDMFSTPNSATVGADVINAIYSGFDILNRLSLPQTPVTLRTFKENFYKRYEDEEVPLVEVLDTEIGIGFSTLTPESSGQNTLLENIILERKTLAGEYSLSLIEHMLLRKYHDYLRNDLDEVEILDSDVAGFPINNDDLPGTMASLIEVVRSSGNKEPLILMNGVAGPSATNLLTRFAQGNDEILRFVKEIVSKEVELVDGEKLIAEIVHLPESRTGNILFRPVTRKYEIPYLAHPGVESEDCILISDIMISIVSGRLKLRSKRLNKEILPRLSSAHNFINNSLPIYHFLCMVQYENVRSSISFNWGTVLSQEKHLPRVLYKNVILSPALWIIEEKEIADLLNLENENFYARFQSFRSGKSIPAKCLLSYSDNKIMLDLEDNMSIKLLLSEIKKKGKVKVEEFLFCFDDMIVQDNDQSKYVNQFLFAFQRSSYDN